MEYFSLCLDGLSLLGQSVLHLLFLGRFAGRRPRLRHFAAYFFLLTGISLLAGRLDAGGSWALGAGVLALYGLGRLALGTQRPASWLGAVLAFYISQLSFGLVNSVESIAFPRAIGSPVLYLLVLAALAVSFGLCALCYAAVLRLLPRAEEGQYLGLLLFPTLFFFAAELYILQTAYGTIVSDLSPAAAGRHGALLLLQGMGLAALLCTLYAWRQLCLGFQAREALASVTQAARAQRVYVAEAQARYEQTRAFRHDIKNHLAVLDGLLRGGRAAEGLAYLERMEAASASLSLPCRTGRAVVDILLGEKLALAEDIAAEVSLVLPVPCGVDDFDLCVIFANALDNAVAACRAAEGERSLRITGQRQGDFYLLSFVNTCSGGPLPPAGTGLRNIRSVAEKYRGAVLTEKTGGQFTLSVLLDIS